MKRQKKTKRKTKKKRQKQRQKKTEKDKNGKKVKDKKRKKTRPKDKNTKSQSEKTNKDQIREKNLKDGISQKQDPLRSDSCYLFTFLAKLLLSDKNTLREKVWKALFLCIFHYIRINKFSSFAGCKIQYINVLQQWVFCRCIPWMGHFFKITIICLWT